MDTIKQQNIPKYCNRKTFSKMLFIYNAVNTGWSVSNKEDKYIFTKSHEKCREIYDDTYLETFIQNNLDFLPK